MTSCASRSPCAKQGDTLTARPIVAHKSIHRAGVCRQYFPFRTPPFGERSCSGAKREYPLQANNNTEMPLASLTGRPRTTDLRAPVDVAGST